MMPTWKCVANCGACCYLNPTDRPALEYYLTPAEMSQYLALVGSDGWCIHFDHSSRTCRIYTDRPYFCRVEAEVFEKLYDVPPSELNDFAIACCEEHIGDLYGLDSPEYDRFQKGIGKISVEEKGNTTLLCN